MDIFHQVFEPQLRSSNQKLSPPNRSSISTHQMRARKLRLISIIKLYFYDIKRRIILPGHYKSRQIFLGAPPQARKIAILKT